MELEFYHDGLEHYQLVLDTTLTQEETQEAIVPDACPDIMRILETRAQIFLTGKQVREGMAMVSGLLRADVFYLPEDQESCVRHLEIPVTFSTQTEAPGLSSSGTLLAIPRVRWAQARILNPRKVLLRADIAVEIRAYQPVTTKLCCGVKDGDSYMIQQRILDKTTDIISAVQEKPFTFSDRIELSVQEGEKEALLFVHGEPVCTERKLIGSKMIFKGCVELDALIRSGNDLRTLHQSMSFSQIMEVSGAGENSSCEVSVSLTDLTLEREGTSEYEVTVELLAQAVVCEHRSLTLLSDLYSTAWNTDLVSQPLQLHHIIEESTRSVPVRELVETTTPVRGIVQYWADLGDVHTQLEAGQPVLSAEVHLTAIYMDDAQQPQSIHKLLSVTYRGEVHEKGRCQLSCSAPRELFLSPAAGGLEVRFSLDVCSLSCLEAQISMISSAELIQERMEGENDRPSVILRMAAPGEELWDIAKAYGTTQADISAANELEDGVLPVGRMLLIPGTH